MFDAFDQLADQASAFAIGEVFPERLQILDRRHDRVPIGRGGVDVVEFLLQFGATAKVTGDLFVERRECVEPFGFAFVVAGWRGVGFDGSFGVLQRQREGREFVFETLTLVAHRLANFQTGLIEKVFVDRERLQLADDKLFDLLGRKRRTRTRFVTAPRRFAANVVAIAFTVSAAAAGRVRHRGIAGDAAKQSGKHALRPAVNPIADVDAVGIVAFFWTDWKSSSSTIASCSPSWTSSW